MTDKDRDAVKQKWEEAQRREFEYTETGKDRVWGIPHSLVYWKQFLCLRNIDGCGVEIGCGRDGIYRFAPNITGIDPIDFSHLCTNFRQGMGEDLPFKDKSADFVICCNALDHCLDPQKVVSEIFRISNRFILWTYIHPRPIASVLNIVERTHPYHFTATDVDDLLADYPHVITRRYVSTFFDVHLKYTKSLFASLKLFVAHFLGVRGLCLHIELTEGD